TYHWSMCSVPSRRSSDLGQDAECQQQQVDRSRLDRSTRTSGGKTMIRIEIGTVNIDTVSQAGSVNFGNTLHVLESPFERVRSPEDRKSTRLNSSHVKISY